MRHILWMPEGWVKNARPNRRWRKEQRMAWVFALFFLVPPSPAHATTVVKMALETVVAEADRIAVCQVIDITPSRDLKSGAPITRVTFEPVEGGKGTVGSEPSLSNFWADRPETARSSWSPVCHSSREGIATYCSGETAIHGPIRSWGGTRDNTT